MNRASWKIPYLNNSFFRLISRNNDKPHLIWTRSSSLLIPHIGKLLKVYNGKKFVSIQVKKPLLGHYVGSFCMSKLLGRKIHQRKKKKTTNRK